MLSLIRTGEDPDKLKLIKQIDDWQAALMSPKNFTDNGPEGFIAKFETSFENLCATLEDLGVSRPQELTVFQFYTRLIYFEKKKRNKPPGKP